MPTKPELTIDEIRAKYEDLATVTRHGTPPGDWFQRWMDDVGKLLTTIAWAKAIRDLAACEDMERAIDNLRATAERLNAIRKCNLQEALEAAGVTACRIAAQRDLMAHRDFQPGCAERGFPCDRARQPCVPSDMFGPDWEPVKRALDADTQQQAAEEESP